MPAFAANIDFLFCDLPKHERVGRAAAARFQGIEVGHLSAEELAAVRTALRRNALEVVLVNLAPGDLRAGGTGYMGVPGQRAVVEREVRQALHNARSLGCRRIAVSPSRLPKHLDKSACLAALTDNLAWAADLTLSEGIEILIEPLNAVDWPGFLVASTDEALDAITAVDRTNVGLQLDLYHAAMQGESPLDSIRRAGRHLRHVQFADMPGRHEPGTGMLPLTDAFALLDELGYCGWVAAEYIPSRSTEETLAWFSGDPPT